MPEEQPKKNKTIEEIFSTQKQKRPEETLYEWSLRLEKEAEEELLDRLIEGLKSRFIPYKEGFLNEQNVKILKFGRGNKSIKTDYRYGFWAGSEIYNIAPFRVSSAGTIYADTILLKNWTTLPTSATVGELAVSNGTLYVCATANVWSVVGKQT